MSSKSACVAALLAGVINSQAPTYQFPYGHDPYAGKRNHVSESIITRHYYRDDFMFHIMVPCSSATYPWVDFHHGFMGAFPSDMYQEFLREWVQAGYVVTYTQPHVPHEDAYGNLTLWTTAHDMFELEGDAMVEEMMANYGYTVHVDMNSQGIACHSNGCDVTKQYADRDASKVKNYYFLDPVFKYADIDTPVQLPEGSTISVQATEYCDACCVDSSFTQRIFDAFNGASLKMKTTIAEAGHCSPIAWYFAETCRRSHYCDEPEETRQGAFRLHACMAGVGIAASQDGWFDRADLRPYYTNGTMFCDAWDYVVDDIVECVGPNCPV